MPRYPRPQLPSDQQRLHFIRTKFQAYAVPIDAADVFAGLPFEKINDHRGGLLITQRQDNFPTRAFRLEQPDQQPVCLLRSCQRRADNTARSLHRYRGHRHRKRF